MRVLRYSMARNIITLILAAIIGTGCSTSTNIRASETLLKKNDMKKVAILASGYVEWPRINDRPVLSVKSTNETFDFLVPITKETLNSKGYEVVFCEPVAIAYFSSNANWVKEDDEGNAVTGLKTLRSKEPVYEFPILNENPAFKAATRKIFESIEISIVSNALKSFTPSKTEIEMIAQKTKADTICFMRIFGKRHNLSKKIGQGFLAALTNPYGANSNPLTDYTESFYTCADAGTGNVLWQNGQIVLHDSWGIDDKSKYLNLVESILLLFPDAGNPLSSQCVKLDPKSEEYSCKVKIGWSKVTASP